MLQTTNPELQVTGCFLRGRAMPSPSSLLQLISSAVLVPKTAGETTGQTREAQGPLLHSWGPCA